MYRLLAYAAPLAILAGCPTTTDTGEKDTSDTVETGDTEETDTDTGGTGSWSASATWSGNGVSVVITGGTDTTGYDFGMAQTGADDGWAGEDCLSAVPAGYDYMIDGGYQFCHHFPQSGGSLETVAEIIDITEGATTLLSQATEATLTYVTFDSADACVVWGDDPGYFAEFGCTAI